MLLLSLAIFTIFSLASGFAQTLVQLIIFRALAGVGGAGIATLVLISECKSYGTNCADTLCSHF